LAQLCAMDSRAKTRSPEIIAEALRVRQTELIAFSVEGDTLFPHKAQESFYHLVTECLPAEERWRMKFVSTVDHVNGHDHFLTSGFEESGEKLRPYIG
jgi:homoserine acetyltransferase